MVARAMEARRISCFTRGLCISLWQIARHHAAAVVDATGRAVRIREMHQVPQLGVPVTHTRLLDITRFNTQRSSLTTIGPAQSDG